jgi:hypothetical protein
MRALIKTPIDLAEFLKKYGHELRGVRAFYIVEPLLEKGANIKFGVAGMDSGNAYERFRSYQIAFGNKAKDNPCKGVIVHYVGITEYNRLVERPKSEVWRLERFLKGEYRTITDPERGEERVPKDKLQEILRYIRAQKFKDVETVRRPGQRTTTLSVRTEDRSSHKPGQKRVDKNLRPRKKT